VLATQNPVEQEGSTRCPAQSIGSRRCCASIPGGAHDARCPIARDEQTVQRRISPADVTRLRAASGRAFADDNHRR
jgi:hypothetical protein